MASKAARDRAMEKASRIAKGGSPFVRRRADLAEVPRCGAKARFDDPDPYAELVCTLPSGHAGNHVGEWKRT